MLLSIIIVSYNTKDLTQQSIEYAWKDAQRSQLLKDRTEILVIDNNSTDGSAEALKKVFGKEKHISILSSKKNLGFAAGNNAGIEKAQGEYIFLLNSDTMVQKGALETLVQTYKQHPVDEADAVLFSEKSYVDRVGIVAATLLNTDGTLQPQGGSLPSLVSIATHMFFLDDLPLIGSLFPSTQHTGFRQTEKLRYHTDNPKLIPRGWVGGTAVLIRRQVIEEIGNLDDSLFMYGEDVEFCLRAQNHHWDVVINPLAKVIHIGSASGSSSTALTKEFEAYVYIWSKHKPLWQMPLLKTLLWLGALLRVLVFTITRQPKRAEVYKKMVKSGFNTQ